ncbi:MAG: metal-sensitive transcriptional regulator [Anaerolineae bacterium]
MAPYAPVEQEQILGRLRRVEGQIRGIQKMLEENRDCEAVVTQLMAARAALDKVSLVIITQHLQQCLTQPPNPGETNHLERIMSFFLKLTVPGDSDRLSDSDAKS